MTEDKRLILLLRAGDVASVYLACTIMKNWVVKDVERIFDLASTTRDLRVGNLQISERMIETQHTDPFLIIKEDGWILLHNRDHHIYLMKYGQKIIGNWRRECEAHKGFLYI